MDFTAYLASSMPDYNSSNEITETFSTESFNLYSEVFITLDDLNTNKINFERI